ncbi:MAG: hypothetical protein IKR18_00965 [Bacteroidaceae bacterium]|nr:hypothetical protein [Bacteroidaceae bacterium]
MKNRTQVFEWASTLIVAVIIFCFFYFYAWGGMYCYGNEELFLLSTDYFLRYLSYPSGFLQLAAKLFAQFLIFRFVGATMFSLLIILLQRSVWKVASVFKRKHIYYLLSFIILDLFFFDNVIVRGYPMLTVGCVLNYFVFLLAVKVKETKTRYCIESVLLFLMYWLTGGVFFVLATLLIAYEVRYYLLRKMYYEALFCLVIIIFNTLLYPCIASYYFEWNFSEVAMFANVGSGPSVIFYLSLASVLPLVIAYIPKLNFVNDVLLHCVQLLLVVVYVCFGVNSINRELEYLYRDVYFASNNQWESICENAKDHKPDYMSRCVIRNIALQKCGKMVDEFYKDVPSNYRLFLFPQDDMQRASFSFCASTGIVAYELGLENLALEYFTEYNASQLVDNLNVLFLKYQVKVLIARGDYKVANKLLNILKKTLFHRKWACEMSEFLYNDKKVMQNEELAKFRKMKYPENLVYSMIETDVVLYTLYKSNLNNKALYEYLLFEILRHRDLRDFAIVYDLGSKYIEYPKGIPLNFQQALSLYWVMAGKSLDEIPYYIETQVLQDCLRIYYGSKHNENVLPFVKKKYPGTFWVYYFNN